MPEILIWILLVLGVLAALAGVGFAGRFVVNMIGGAGMGWGTVAQLSVIGAIGLALGFWLLSWTLPAVIS